MHRDLFLTDLKDYAASWAAGRAAYRGFVAQDELAVVELFRGFVGDTPACFERTWSAGHITGSALVVSPDLKQVLMTLHGKLNKWLQLGGHADGEPRPDAVAWREAEEESGLTALTALRYEARFYPERRATHPLPFDLDRHAIPARKQEAAHYHYDARYLIVADPGAPLGISDESQDLRWFSLAEARQVTDEPSMHRQFAKLDWLREQQFS